MTKFSNNPILRVFYFLILILVFIGCKNNNSYNDKHQYNFNDSTNLLPDEVEFSFGVYYLFPSPVEIIEIINDTGMHFKKQLLNPIDNIDYYITDIDLLINMGVYLTDFSYSTIKGKRNDALELLNIIFELTEKTRISSALDTDFSTRAQNNINNIDSLTVLANEAYFNIINNLEENNRLKEIAFITAGAYIECLYVSLNLVDGNKNSDVILQAIADQKLILENLLQYVKHIREDKYVDLTYEYIDSIMNVFNEFPVHETEINVGKNDENILNVSGGSSIIIDQKGYIKLRDLVEDFRQKITKNLTK